MTMARRAAWAPLRHQNRRPQRHRAQRRPGPRHPRRLPGHGGLLEKDPRCKKDGTLDIPLDQWNYHQYSNDAGSTQNGGQQTRGVAPENGGLGATARRMVAFASTYGGNKPVVITETGYDVNPRSPLAAVRAADLRAYPRREVIPAARLQRTPGRLDAAHPARSSRRWPRRHRLVPSLRRQRRLALRVPDQRPAQRQQHPPPGRRFLSASPHVNGQLHLPPAPERAPAGGHLAGGQGAHGRALAARGVTTAAHLFSLKPPTTGTYYTPTLGRAAMLRPSCR
ncbi:MAG: hypothetical protein WKG07_38165 [Hymenobacter sp.]